MESFERMVSDWKLRDWIKAGIVVIVVLVVLKIIIIPGA